MNTPPSLNIVAPANGSTVSINDFNLTISATDYPDFALWAELTVSSSLLPGLPGLPIPVVMMKNGIWSTSDLPYWDSIRGAIGSLMISGVPYSLVLKLKATDFDTSRYSNEVTLAVTLTK